MNDSHTVSIAQIREFIKVARTIEFQGVSRKEKYQWLEEIIFKFKYFHLKKKEKSVLKTYMAKMTGFSDAQITRLIAKKKKFGIIRVKESVKKRGFERKYTTEDIGLLVETDNAHSRLSGPATKRIFVREYAEFGKDGFKRLRDISIAHIYNLRSTRSYQSLAKFFTKTKPTVVNIGESRKPAPDGNPGYIRVDTVHQGDLDKEKGVYHINLVDEVTQWEIVAAVERISEYYLLPVLEEALRQFPFKILGFHSDNGSEYINKTVAGLLNKLLIKQTKSRSRHCNDNALVESKNSSIIRKHIGYVHIPRCYAAELNQFYREYLNIYLNYHRPCGFATERIDKKGKIKKVYDVYRTPYEAFRSHLNALDFLKEGVSFEILDKISYAKSDNEFAALMQKAKVELFKELTSRNTQFPTTYNSHLGLIA